MCTIHKRTGRAQQQQEQNLIEKWKSTWIDFFKEYTNGQKVYEKSSKSFIIMEMKVKSIIN